MGYDFEVKYKKGIFNRAADYLSRYPSSNELINNLNSNNKNDIFKINLVQPINITVEQANNAYLHNIKHNY